VLNASAVVGNLSLVPATPSRPAEAAPTITSNPSTPFEPSPLGASSPSNGPSPFVLLLLALGAVSLGIFLGPRVRRFTGYWVAEARLGLASKKPPVS
jgi:hypothetical protein